MSYYASIHPDYTSARWLSSVDQLAPEMIYLIQANNATDALRETAELDSDMHGDDFDPDDIADETTLVKLDPMFAVLREQGWTIIPPEEQSEEKSTATTVAS